MIRLYRGPQGYRTLTYGGPCGNVVLRLAKILHAQVLNLHRGMFAGASIEFLRDAQFRGVLLTDWRIESVAPILSMEDLEILALSTPKARRCDVGRLSELIELSVDFSGALTSLSACRKLRRLFLGQYGSASLAELGVLESLISLDVVAPELQDVTHAEWTDLASLDLRDVRRLTTLNGIQKNSRLQRVCINHAPRLTDISALAGLAHLKTLILIDVGEIDSLSPLAGACNLEEVIVTGSTTIRDGRVSVLASLPHLMKCDFVERRTYDMSLDAILAAVSCRKHSSE